MGAALLVAVRDRRLSGIDVPRLHTPAKTSLL